MKNTIFTMFFIAVIFMLFSTNVFAEENVIQNNIRVFIDGEEVEFPEGAKPFIDTNNRAFISARFVAEKLGYKVVWHGEDSTIDIAKGDKKITLQVNSNIVKTTHAGIKAMDTKVVKIEDRCFVPIRTVTEILGDYKIDYKYERGYNNIYILPKDTVGSKVKTEENDVEGVFEGDKEFQEKIEGKIDNYDESMTEYARDYFSFDLEGNKNQSAGIYTFGKDEKYEINIQKFSQQAYKDVLKILLEKATQNNDESVNTIYKEVEKAFVTKDATINEWLMTNDYKFKLEPKGSGGRVYVEKR